MSPAPPASETRRRDAARSRSAILDAAERLFARRGYEATSLADVGQEAGVSRGTPSYFFGSKEELYVAVLERMYEDRNEALAPVFAPLVEWADADEPGEPLEAVLKRAVAGYLAFLRTRPAFVDIFEREALAGGRRLARVRSRSTVMEDAFAALQRSAPSHGLARFDVPEVVMALIALAYLPVAHRHTILRRHGLSLDDDAFLTRRTEHVADVLAHLVGAG